MKRLSVLLALAMLICLLGGCNILTTVSGLQQEAENLPVEAAAKALTEGDEDAFRACLHPSVNWENCKIGYQNMTGNLRGQKVTGVQMLDWNTTISSGTSGKFTTISVIFRIDLENGNVLVNAIYEKTGEGEGFTQYLLEMGIAKT